MVIELAPVLQLYVYSPLPPAMVTVADPLFVLQLVFTEDVVAVSVELLPTVIDFTDVHPDPSTTVTV